MEGAGNTLLASGSWACRVSDSGPGTLTPVPSCLHEKQAFPTVTELTAAVCHSAFLGQWRQTHHCHAQSWNCSSHEVHGARPSPTHGTAARRGRPWRGQRAGGSGTSSPPESLLPSPVIWATRGPRRPTQGPSESRSSRRFGNFLPPSLCRCLWQPERPAGTLRLSQKPRVAQGVAWGLHNSGPLGPLPALPSGRVPRRAAAHKRRAGWAGRHQAAVCRQADAMASSVAWAGEWCWGQRV